MSNLPPYRRSERLLGWQTRREREFGSITANQFIGLRALYNAQQIGLLSHQLNINLQSINVLLKKGWIRWSSGRSYTITPEGVCAFEAFKRPRRGYHTDGLCPACRQRPKADGKPYCDRCYVETGKRRRLDPQQRSADS